MDKRLDESDPVSVPQHIYSKNTVVFLDYIVAHRHKPYCNLKGELYLGYPALITVVIEPGRMGLKSLRGTREQVLDCPAEFFVGYGLVVDERRENAYKYAVALLFNRFTKTLAYFTPFADDSMTDKAVKFMRDSVAPQYALHRFHAHGEVERLKEATEYLMGEKFKMITLEKFAGFYRNVMTNIIERTYNSFWGELQHLEPYRGSHFNKRDWPFMSVVVEEISAMYNLDAVCRRRRLPPSKLAQGLSVVETRSGKFTVEEEGDEEIPIRDIVVSCSGRMAVFSVGVRELNRANHANSLIVDGLRKEVELFEPNGLTPTSGNIAIAVRKYVKLRLPDYEFMSPLEFCPVLGLQQAHMNKRRRMDPDFNEGLCVTFNLIYTASRVINPNKSRADVITLLMLDIEEHADFIERFITLTRKILDKQ